jgi:hypothetical protein
MPEGFQVEKQKCYVEVPFFVTGALVAKTKEKAPGWNQPDNRIAQAIANAVATKDIKKALDELKGKDDDATKEWATCISLTFPKSQRASVPIVVCVGKKLIEIHPNYEKPHIKITANA